MKPIYISGTGAVSPQPVADNTDFLSTPSNFSGDRLSCIEPDYAKYIDQKALRRMSRVLKMGTAASMMALEQAGVGVPDGIITGTGYGCLEDTGTFIQKMILQNEEALNPTPFIQSTHNTIGSQIALQLQCLGYNQTYTQGNHSFESALLDAQLSLNEKPNQVLLAGAVDEITDVSHAIQKRFRVFREHSENSLDLFQQKKRGTLQGEGAFYFTLSGAKGDKSFASIIAVRSISNPSYKSMIGEFKTFLKDASVSLAEIDMVLVGKNGDAAADFETDELIAAALDSPTIGLFKHLSGEYPTASAFAVWLTACIFLTNHVPAVVADATAVPKTVLIYNPTAENGHSLILLRSC